jgi:hypothetical protein
MWKKFEPSLGKIEAAINALSGEGSPKQSA